MYTMEAVKDEAVWNKDEGSQLFREHVEEEIRCCQSGQQSILDLVGLYSCIQLPILHYMTPHDISARSCVSSRCHQIHAITRHCLQVKKLGMQLTSTDEILRYKGTLLLAKVTSCALPFILPSVLKYAAAC